MYGLYFRSSAFSSYKQRKTSKRFSLNETVIGAFSGMARIVRIEEISARER